MLCHWSPREDGREPSRDLRNLTETSYAIEETRDDRKRRDRLTRTSRMKSRLQDMEMGAQEARDLDVVYLGSHGHEELVSVATDDEASEEEGSPLQAPYANRFSRLTCLPRPLDHRRHVTTLSRRLRIMWRSYKSIEEEEGTFSA